VLQFGLLLLGKGALIVILEVSSVSVSNPNLLCAVGSISILVLRSFENVERRSRKMTVSPMEAGCGHPGPSVGGFCDMVVHGLASSLLFFAAMQIRERWIRSDLAGGIK
jgi:hypothetical protein